MRTPLLFLFLVLLPSLSWADQETACFEKNSKIAHEKQLWKSKRWLDLGHYREGWFSAFSEVDGKGFFLHPDGASSPKDELFATIKNLCANTQLKTESKQIPKMQASCLYPARQQYFQSEGLGGWPQPDCPHQKEWKARIGSERVYLVFSSYYANNPSSVFGHTLLRFDRKQGNTGKLYNPLLNHGVNFAGESTTTNGVLFALLGMTGGFKGKFASLPYYYKVRQYSDFDSRDLWEYELNLSEEEKELLLNLLWEQGFTYFNYYYFTENCSYHLLTSLDAAVPRFELDTKIPYWVIPIDSIKAVTQKSPGLIKSVSFRPSLYRQFNERLKILKNEGLEKDFYQYLENRDQKMSALSQEQQALVLDAALDYWDYKYAKPLLDPNSPASKSKVQLLKTRASLPITPPLKIDQNKMERPDDSHESLRLGFSGGHESTLGDFYEFDLRFALHDFLDPRKGYPKTAKIEFFRVTTLYFPEEDHLRMDRLTFFDVQLLSPLKKLERSWSWRAMTALDRSRVDCDQCLASIFLLQGGGTLSAFDSRAHLYLLGGAEFAYSPGFLSEEFRSTPLGTLGLRLHLPQDLNFLLESEYRWHSTHSLKDSFLWGGELRKALWLNGALGLSFNIEEQESFRDEKHQFHFYYYF